MQLNYLFEADKKSLSLNSHLKNRITSPANYVWGAPLPYGLFVPELNPKITYSLYNEVDHEDYEVMAEVEPEYVEVEDEPEEGGISEGKRGDSEFWAARGKKEADFWAARYPLVLSFEVLERPFQLLLVFWEEGDSMSMH